MKSINEEGGRLTHSVSSRPKSNHVGLKPNLKSVKLGIAKQGWPKQ